MATNLSFDQRLIEELPMSGMLAGGKPAGREGFEVIVIERNSTGSQYYATLLPGDMLRISERLFGSYSAYAVDIRPSRVLEISEQFPTLNPLVKVKVTAKVLYYVINARRVAIEVEDPLAKFRDRILGVLRRDIGRLAHQKATEAECERMIIGVGTVQHLGLTVEGVDVITVEADNQVIRGMQQRAELDYNRGLGEEVDEEAHRRALRKQAQQQELQRRELEAKLELERRQQQHTVESQRETIDAFNLGDLNTLLHMRPELTEAIFLRLTAREQQDFQVQLEHDSLFRNRMLQVLDNYIRSNEDANPDELLRLVREVSTQSRDIRPRITFGTPSPDLPQIGTGAPPTSRITFGKVIEGQVVPPSPPSPPQDDD